jgi:glycosyltransferase involved in cell wall biosynthesis
MALQSTVVITTRNRSEELRVALRSAMGQTYPCEIIVIDDASDDGTAEMVKAEFPGVRLESNARNTGYIAARNRGAQLAAGDVIFSIDDDAAFSTPQVVAQTLADFSDPRIGAVAIPFADVNKDNVVKQRAPDREGVWITDRYIGTAHAVRRDVFLKAGGYRDFFVHQGEEGDFCLRMLAGGHVVRLGNADPVHHFESPKRDFSRMDYYGRRNDVLYSWCNVPMPWLLPHMAATLVNGLRTAWRVGRCKNMLRGMMAGLGECLTHRRDRAPVSSSIYRLSRKLKARPATALEDCEKLLPDAI